MRLKHIILNNVYLNIYPQALLIGEQQCSATAPKLCDYDHNLSNSVLWVIKTSNHLQTPGYFSWEAMGVLTRFSCFPGLGRRFAAQFNKINFSEKCFQENPLSGQLLWTFKMLFIIDEYSNNRFISTFAVLGNGISVITPAHVPTALLPWAHRGDDSLFSEQECRLSLYYNIWSLFMFPLCLPNSPFYLQISYINMLLFQHWLFIWKINQLAKGKETP